MEKYRAREKLKVYISYAFADSAEAEVLQKFLINSIAWVNCDRTPYDSPDDQRVKLSAVKSIRACDLFILLISRKSFGPGKWIRKPSRHEYAEAVNFKKRIVFLLLDDPRKISPHLTPKLSNRPKSSYLVLPEEDRTGVNQQALLKVFKEMGCQLIGEDLLAEAYDVFISFKSEDHNYAKKVYDFLQSRKLKVFLSKESLPLLGSAEYHEQIDLAIERARHMVVVTTSKKHVTSKWVEYEWRLFQGEILAGRKEGNLLTVVAEGLDISDLPISLRNREVIPLVEGEIEKLLDYVRQ